MTSDELLNPQTSATAKYSILESQGSKPTYCTMTSEELLNLQTYATTKYSSTPHLKARVQNQPIIAIGTIEATNTAAATNNGTLHKKVGVRN